MASDVDMEWARLLPKLKKVERAIKDAGLTHGQTAALMTMAAARLMSTAGAMMAAISDAKAGRPPSSTPNDIADWTEMTAKEVVRIVRAGAVN